MKVHLNLLVLYFCIPCVLQAQWNNLGGQIAFDSYLGVANEDTLVLSDSESGIIYHSFDGGASWSPFQTILDGSWLFAFDFPTDAVGYGVGGTFWGDYKGVVVKTIDGGATWGTLITNRGGVHQFQYVEFLNADTGFVADVQKLYRTTDGGQSFTQVHIVDDEDYFAYRALGSNADGVLFSSNKRAVFTPFTFEVVYMYRSVDLGETWTEVYTDTIFEGDPLSNDPYVNQIRFPTPDVGYAVGGKGLFLKSTDGGFHWDQSFIDPFSKLSALSFTSAEEGYINNDNGIFKTTDGGETWVDQNVGNNSTIIRDIQFASATTGYARSDVRLFKTTNGGGGSTGISDPDAKLAIKVFPNPANRVIRLRDPMNVRIQKVEIIDPLGRTLRSINGRVAEIDAGSLPEGSCFLRIQTRRGVTVRRVEIVH